MNNKKCPHLNCLVYHPDGICTCDIARYCEICKKENHPRLPKEAKTMKKKATVKFDCEITEWNGEKWLVVKKFKKHLWVRELVDCPFCGGGEIKTCKRCGEEK